MIRPILQRGAPVLAVKCKEVRAFDGELVKLVREMIETLKAADGAGLAAPQIGVNKRIFVYQAQRQLPLHYGVMINPEFVKLWGRPVPMIEGCLSVRDLHVQKERYAHVVIKGQLMNGTGYRIDTSETGRPEFTAQVFQHEMDHLEGKLIV